MCEVFLMPRHLKLVFCVSSWSTALTMLRSLLSRLPNGGLRYGAQTYFYRQYSDDISKRIAKLIKKDKIVVFMKGSPEEPCCSFSAKAAGVLNYHGVSFQHYDVLQDYDLRQGIKKFTKWPTIPQIFFGGVFIGGADIIMQKHCNGEIIGDLKSLGLKSKAEDNVKSKSQSSKNATKDKFHEDRE